MTTSQYKRQIEKYKRAAARADWGQVVANGGPPCFHVEGGKFCLRAKPWAGHGIMHRYVSLEELFSGLKTEGDR